MVMSSATTTTGMETSTLEQSAISTATKTTNWKELPSKVTNFTTINSGPIKHNLKFFKLKFKLKWTAEIATLGLQLLHPDWLQSTYVALRHTNAIISYYVFPLNGHRSFDMTEFLRYFFCKIISKPFQTIIIYCSILNGFHPWRYLLILKNWRIKNA